MNRLVITTLVAVGVSALGAPVVSNALSYVSYPQSSFYYYDPYVYESPQASWCGSYYGSCQIGTQHTFAPYTYVNIDPYTYTNVGTYQYPAQTYTYPNQQSSNYSYPQYQGYSQPNYQSNYQPSYSQDYGYSSYPSYTPYYMSGGEYCYSGYGCYPLYVEDPHQWVYDQWTGTGY